MAVKTKGRTLKKMGSDFKRIKPGQKRLDGVAYDRVNGVVCPSCKMQSGYITNTLPWEDGVRIRYHQCRRCGIKFKSTETE